MGELMRRAALAAGIAGLVLLASCATSEHLAAEDDAACAGIGIGAASPNYASCRLVMEERRIEARRESAARMQALGAAMTSASRAMDGARGASSSASSHTGTACFGRGEARSGLNKICYYSCTGSTVAHNVGSADLCPLTISR